MALLLACTAHAASAALAAGAGLGPAPRFARAWIRDRDQQQDAASSGSGKQQQEGTAPSRGFEAAAPHRQEHLDSRDAPVVAAPVDPLGNVERLTDCLYNHVSA